ncbi:hypothetical protein GLA29479_3314 [Lysobacter antibioticus]|nr:hypothetical protein GLA29479_3314 [Lysobacter antibioticus]
MPIRWWLQQQQQIPLAPLLKGGNSKGRDVVAGRFRERDYEQPRSCWCCSPL